MKKMLMLIITLLILINSIGLCFAEEVVKDVELKNLVDDEIQITIDPLLPQAMITDILNSELMSPISDEELQLLIDEEEIYIRYCYVENGKMFYDYDFEMINYDNKFMEIVKVLVAHAKKNGHMIAIGPDGLSRGIYIWYGEDLESLKIGRCMFRIGFRRPKGTRGEEQLDGKTYPIEEEVRIGAFATPPELFREKPDVYERIKYMTENNYTDINAFYALYDGLRLLDSGSSQELFVQIIEDYCYALSHDYGKTGGLLSRYCTQYLTWLDFGDRKICKEEWRNSHAKYASLEYMFLRQFNKDMN